MHYPTYIQLCISVYIWLTRLVEGAIVTLFLINFRDNQDCSPSIKY